jgi:hypothetical protein
VIVNATLNIVHIYIAQMDSRKIIMVVQLANVKKFALLSV